MKGHKASSRAPGVILALAAVLATAAQLRAEDAVLIADQPWLCRSVEPLLEMRELAEDGEGMRARMDVEVKKGTCRVGKPELQVTIVDVDQQGFVAVEEPGQPDRWWIEHEDVWPPDEADAKLKAWKKP